MTFGTCCYDHAGTPGMWCSLVSESSLNLEGSLTTLVQTVMGYMWATSECACSIIWSWPTKNLLRLLPLPYLPRWFSILMYLAFLIAVLVVLLNVLIAQMSNTYNEIQINVNGAFAIARARIIARLQKERWPICKGKVRKYTVIHVCVYLYKYGWRIIAFLLCCVQTFRKSYFKKCIWTGWSS